MRVPDVAFSVEEVKGRPIAIVIGPPCFVVVVLHNGPCYSEIFRMGLHITEYVLIGEFGGVNTDDLKSLVVVPSIQVLDIWKRVDAVVAAEGPEIDDHYFAAQI